MVVASESDLFSLGEDDEDDEDDLIFSRTIVGEGQANRKPPRSVYKLAVLSAIGGFLFGYDTGVVSGAMVLVRKDFRLTDIWHEVIVSATVAAAFAFSFVGADTSDRFGRRPTILLASVTFTIGSFFMGMASGKWMLLLGRVIVGVAIGLSSMSVPMYIAEACPANRRGELVVLNNLFITGGQFAAGVVCGALSGAREGWRYMLGAAAAPAIFQFFGFVGQPESPRYLVMKGQYDRASEVLSSLRNPYDDVHEELEEMKVTAIRDAKNAKGFSEIIKHKALRRALVVGCSLQLFQQLSGINTVMYYSARIIQLAGFDGNASAIWLSAATSAVNFGGTFVGLRFVDSKGRRPLLFASLWGVCVSLGVLSGSFWLVNRQARSVPAVVDNATTTACLAAGVESCFDCVEAASCGFCVDATGHSGTCLQLTNNHSLTYCPVRAVDIGEIISPPSATCPSGWLSWLPVLALCLYLASFSPGMGPLPWTVNAEIYPTWGRSACAGVATAVNWGSNLVVSLTFLSLMDLLGQPGAFLLYACLALTGLVFFYFRLPETKGLSLEETEALFAEPGGGGVEAGQQQSKSRRRKNSSSSYSVAYSRISNPLDPGD